MDDHLRILFCFAENPWIHHLLNLLGHFWDLFFHSCRDWGSGPVWEWHLGLSGKSAITSHFLYRFSLKRHILVLQEYSHHLEDLRVCTPSQVDRVAAFPSLQKPLRAALRPPPRPPPRPPQRLQRAPALHLAWRWLGWRDHEVPRNVGLMTKHHQEIYMGVSIVMGIPNSWLV